jgi:hypothetical protein
LLLASLCPGLLAPAASAQRGGIEAQRAASESAPKDRTVAIERAELDSDDLGEKTVQRIWKQAMDASWGQIDLARFEEDWKLYVKRYLED